MIGSYFLFFMLLSFLHSWFPGLDLEQYQQSELFEMMKKSPWKFFFLAAIAAPVMEESIFRSLVKPSVADIKLFLCALLFIGALAIIPEKANWILRYTLVFITISLFYYAMGELIPEKYFLKISDLLKRWYLPFWLVGAVIFGMVHVFNYVEGLYFDLVLFILIFPRIIAGFFCGKIKIENRGIFWPILLHSMNNSIVLLLMYPFSEGV
ncbi:CPBP family intramembrane metalloprotease [Christiangramia fulva]|uniref:CPBP family intramembrane metalloprotease n=2 Tax=Christiangramia fulva TaxID=2126553 RepID=A0A2R3ZBA1_9FLAO|nr:CPBP family intramembrane metalloprotease [Christiangramia fulva]